MDLQRGVCTFCTNNNKILCLSEGSKYFEVLTKLLNGNFLSETELQKIEKSLKVCILCSWKLVKLREINKAITFKQHEKKRCCYFCESLDDLISVPKTWKHFEEITNDIASFDNYPVLVCNQCVFYCDFIQTIKQNLSAKYSILSFMKKQVKKTDTITPKRKASNSPTIHTAKRRKIFNNCIDYLEPLRKNKNYKVSKANQKDDKLYNNVAYVDLFTKPAPKGKIATSSFMKIKIKPKRKQKSGRSSRKSLSSSLDNIEETPKVGDSSELAPKRRVSIYVESETSNEEVISNEDNENDISEIVEKYINDTTFNENDNLNLLDDLENKLEDEKEKVINVDEQNTESEPTTENDQNETETTETASNDDLLADELEEIVEQIPKINPTESNVSKDEPNSSKSESTVETTISLSDTEEKEETATNSEPEQKENKEDEAQNLLEKIIEEDSSLPIDEINDTVELAKAKSLDVIQETVNGNVKNGEKSDDSECEIINLESNNTESHDTVQDSDDICLSLTPNNLSPNDSDPLTDELENVTLYTEIVDEPPKLKESPQKLNESDVDEPLKLKESPQKLNESGLEERPKKRVTFTI